MIVIVEYDPCRVDDAQSTLGLNGLQFVRVAPAALQRHIPSQRRAPSKGNDKHSRLKKQTNAMTHLGAFEGVDQTALADIREAEADDADGDAPAPLSVCTP